MGASLYQPQTRASPGEAREVDAPLWYRPRMAGSDPPALWRLADRLGRDWPHLRAAESASHAARATLREHVGSLVPEDSSVVVFGSLARCEYTAGSDLDWTLLIDGRSDRAHHRAGRDIARALAQAGTRNPGPSGVFGSVCFSHPILHQIGGQDDTNRNTTQRILLLLESTAIGRDAAYERVLRLVLERYIEDDRGLLYARDPGQLLPRVLLNDIARYWRTVLIDFVNKQNERERGWALRNIKLRLSRKLIFVSGLLMCFAPALHGDRSAFLGKDDKPDAERIADFLLARIRVRPLDSLAEVCLRPGVREDTARALFDTYDEFLGMLGDPDLREALSRCTMDDLGSSEPFRQASRLARRFQDEGVHRLFFEDDPLLRELITRHGVF